MIECFLLSLTVLLACPRAELTAGHDAAAVGAGEDHAFSLGAHSKHPFLDRSFHVSWSSLTPDKVEGSLKVAVENGRQALEDIKSRPEDQLTYGNTFGALESATEDLRRAWGRLNHLNSVSNNEAQRKVLNEWLPVVSEFYTAIPLDDDLWKVLKSFSESQACRELDDVRKRFVEKACADFVLSGADLDPVKKKRMREVATELAKVTQRYSENVLDATNAFELLVKDEVRLKGLPENAKKVAAEDAKSKGHEGQWRFTLQAPSRSPLMQYVEDEGLRREMWEASAAMARSGEYDNTDLVWQILELRNEKAEILGFDDFADLVLQRRMAKNGASALKFVSDLHACIVDGFQKEVLDLQRYKAEKESVAPDTLLEPWEVGFWAEKQRKERYDFSQELLRPYFAVDGVMAGMFELSSQLFGISIKERKAVFGKPQQGSVEVWDDACLFYEVKDQVSGEHLGSFYADWHPRENKQGGAWMNSLEVGLPPIGEQPRQPHLSLIIGNMTKPTEDKPALLTHYEVQTIFHEFGHLLHQILSEVPVKSLAGTSVPRDFVELPSQIMENFCWDRKSLDFFAKHFETGEVIPDELFDKMIAARNYRSASYFMRQLSLGKLDLELHANLEQYQGRDLDEVEREIMKEYRATYAREVPGMARRFGHLFSSSTGYAAGYYSYKWAEVLDADAFTRFQKEGILNQETGRDLRDKILSRGNSRPVEESFRDFMGREPSQEALLKRYGLR